MKQPRTHRNERRIRKLLHHSLPYVIGGGLVGLVLAAWMAIYQTDLFTVRQIEIQTTTSNFVQEFQVREAVGSYLGESLVFLKTAEVEEEIRTKVVEIASVSVEKLLPNKISIRFEERAPVLAARDAAVIFLVDKEGVIFTQISELDTISVPEITVSEPSAPLEIGTELEPETVDLLVQVAALDWERIGIKVQQLAFLDHFVDLSVIYIQEDSPQLWHIYLSPQKELDYSVKIVDTIVKDAYSKGKKLALIDLRFKNPVVRYR